MRSPGSGGGTVVRVAIIAWGSLIWDPRDLQIEGGWSEDGPSLPVEFARISNGERVTLVVFPGVTSQRTYWAFSKFPNH